MGGRDADGKRHGDADEKRGTNEKLNHVGDGDGDADGKSNHVNGPDERSAMCDKKTMEAFLQALKETGSTGEVARVAEASR